MKANANLDLSPLRSSVLREATLALFRSKLLHALARRFYPTPRLNGCVYVTRYQDVVEVLSRDDVFEVVEDRVRALNDGLPFLLGMQRGKRYGNRTYDRFRDQVTRAFRHDDIGKRVVPIAADRAERVVAGCDGKLEAIRALITHVPFEICRKYYGIPIAENDEKELADRMFLLSTWLFTPGEDEALQAAGEAAKGPLNELATNAIRKAKRDGPLPDTVLARLLTMQKDDADPPHDDDIRTILVGMMMGFVPTCTMAAGHMLDVLLRHASFLAEASRAARQDDDARLNRCLLEAMRFEPLIREPLRICNQRYTLAAGTPREQTIEKGTQVMAITYSAMFDADHVERPESFLPDRPADDFLLFGHGLHRCIGEPLAEAQITQTLKPLLKRHVERAPLWNGGWLKRVGVFPSRLVVQVEAAR